MTSVMSLDFETRSRADLKKVGADNYAQHLSTEILCCSFRLRDDTGDVNSWLWYADDYVDGDLYWAIAGADVIEAHNARFDQLIYECIAVEDHDFPKLPVEKWRCTAAQCRVNAFPATLDGATRAMNARHKKDHRGSALIRKLSKPQKDDTFNEDPELMWQMGAYCEQDALATEGLALSLRPMLDTDQEDWQVNERINDRGIRIDRELATLAQSYAADEKAELGDRLSSLTNGAVRSVTETGKLLLLIMAEFSEGPVFDALKKPRKKPTDPVKFSLDKHIREDLLALPQLDGDLREAVDLIHQGGSTSVAKFTAMLERADPETDRVHGAFVFAGAGQTQRYASRGLQLQNMRRDCFSAEDAEMYLQDMRDDMQLPSPVIDTLARLLRPAVIPSVGCKFVVGDWSAIEARVLPWLSDSKGGRSVLDIFIDGRDIYVETANEMGKYDRQTGKVAVLSLGFGGALGAFKAMAKNYGLELSDSAIKRVVERWREANKWAKDFWDALEHAAIKAVRSPNKVFTAGRIRYIYVAGLLDGTLLCILPNDSVIQYPKAKIENGLVTCMKASVQPRADSNEPWPRMQLWGGFLAENVTQATSACLLREALRDMVDAGAPVVAHAHDEIILDVPEAETDFWKETLQDMMEFVPDWANGLPLKAEPEVMDRYGK